VSVHEALRTLVTRYGERTLEAADDLRATLDDFLEEGQATPGEINLLVDAVRLGAYQQMNSMLSHGADPQTAVEAAGARLAEDRGGDQRSASWACAALGYAAGRVPEALVLAYRSQQPPPGSVGGSLPPPVTEYGIPPAQTVAPGPGQQPVGVYGLSGASAPTQAPNYGPAGPLPPSQGTGSWQAPTPAGSAGGGGQITPSRGGFDRTNPGGRFPTDNPTVQPFNPTMPQTQEIPGIPNNIPRYVPPTPQQQKKDEDDDEDGDN